MTLTFGSLFAGIGGFDLGFERAGMVGKWQVEIDDYCNKVLAKHWPDVERFRDVRKVHGAMAHASSRRFNASRPGFGKKDTRQTPNRIKRFSQDETKHSCPTCLPPVDVICGGFPCQPFSAAGKRCGAEDDRNLWPEFRRIVEEVRPRWVVAENVPGLIKLYLDTVLSDLEGLGYTTGQVVIPAVAFDAPHRRDRLWIVANSDTAGLEKRQSKSSHNGTKQPAIKRGSAMANTSGAKSNGWHNGAEWGQRGQGNASQNGGSGGRVEDVGWPIEPPVGRVAHGIPRRVDRLRALGNAVVPQAAEHIGRLIIEVEQLQNERIRGNEKQNSGTEKHHR